MQLDAKLRSSIISIAKERFGAELQGIELGVSEARGGLESRAVHRFRVRAHDLCGRKCSLTLIAKHLDGAGVREAHVYGDVLSHLGIRIAPSVLKVVPCSDRGVILFLEDVSTRVRWPWHDSAVSAAVLHQLASFHEISRGHAAVLPEWDYEHVLEVSAIATLEYAQRLRRKQEFAWLRRSVHSLDRVVSELPARRRELLELAPLGAGPIHGDVHPGNVIVRSRARGHEPVLIDWARARVGSVLEDVSSWLQSLAYWEPEARRRHDTLLMSYLRARNQEPRLSSELREAYWMAAASNALAGALRYYLVIADGSSNQAKRARAAHAARDWIRMIERAHALSRR